MNLAVFEKQTKQQDQQDQNLILLILLNPANPVTTLPETQPNGPPDRLRR
jgi:hypothetical protein